MLKEYWDHLVILEVVSVIVFIEKSCYRISVW